MAGMSERLTGISVLTHGIRGYASVWGVRDSYGTIFDRGAFSEAVRLHGLGHVTPISYRHTLVRDELGAAVGVVTALREDSLGLYFEAELLHTPAASEALQAVAAGAILGASHSFREPTSVMGDDDTEHIVACSLVELGPVFMPSNPLAHCEVYELPNAAESGTGVK